MRGCSRLQASGLKSLVGTEKSRKEIGSDMSIDFRNGSEIPGGYSGGVTPVPIPNTEVKPSSADYTAAAMQWESKTLPEFFKAR